MMTTASAAQKQTAAPATLVILNSGASGTSKRDETTKPAQQTTAKTVRTAAKIVEALGMDVVTDPDFIEKFFES